LLIEHYKPRPFLFGETQIIIKSTLKSYQKFVETLELHRTNQTTFLQLPQVDKSEAGEKVHQ
jgi:hypothetical protein